MQASPKSVKRWDKVEVTASFKNLLPVTLKNGHFQLEGAGLSPRSSVINMWVLSESGSDNASINPKLQHPSGQPLRHLNLSRLARSNFRLSPPSPPPPLPGTAQNYVQMPHLKFSDSLCDQESHILAFGAVVEFFTCKHHSTTNKIVSLSNSLPKIDSSPLKFSIKTRALRWTDLIPPVQMHPT